MTLIPDDVISAGYREVSPYQWEPVFYSPSLGFEGTEQDFLSVGYDIDYFLANHFFNEHRGSNYDHR